MNGEEKKYILALDHGTSANKATLCTIEGEVVGFYGIEYPIYHPHPGWAEQDPEEWWRAVCGSTRKVLEKAGVEPHEIAGISSSNQMWVTIAVDKDGKPLTKAISWMDSRGAEDVKKVIGGPIAGYSLRALLKWMRIVGAPPSLASKDNFGHILWIIRNHPEIYEETYKFLDAKDYLNFKMTGRMFTSVDTAFLSLLADTRDPYNIRWSKPLLKKIGCDMDKLPEIIPSTAVGGPLTEEAAEEMGLIPGIPVIAGAGDGMCAAIGSGGSAINMPHVSLGTSSWVGCHTPYRKVDIAHYMGSVGSAIPGLYLCIGEQETAGACLGFLKDKILYHKDELLREEAVPEIYQIFDKMAEKILPGSKNLLFTPWLFGEKSPFEDHNARGILFNISLDHSREHLVRAIFEGVAFNIKWTFIYLEKLLKTRLDNIRLIGGGAKSDVWCKIFADIFERKVLQIVDPKESCGRGAALIASVGLKYIKWEDIPSLVKIKKEYKPNKEHFPIYRKLFAQFRKLYKNNKKIFKILNEGSS